MSWSVTVNNLEEYEGFPIETQEFFASNHPSYPRDAANALAIAKQLGLRSATLSGCRTPNPYGGDEIVDVSVRGTPIYIDFLREMREIIATGPSKDSTIARHYAALAVLRGNPCSHVFEPLPGGLKQCLACKVFLNGTMFFFKDADE
jgi:hypothetical protein